MLLSFYTQSIIHFNINQSEQLLKSKIANNRPEQKIINKQVLPLVLPEEERETEEEKIIIGLSENVARLRGFPPAVGRVPITFDPPNYRNKLTHISLSGFGL